MTENDMNEVLSLALSKYGSYLAIKKAVSKLPTVAFHKEVSGAGLKEIEAKICKVGEFVGRDKENELTAIVYAGAANMNPAIIVAVEENGVVHLAAYAKEGLIKQNTVQKAVARILDA